MESGEDSHFPLFMYWATPSRVSSSSTLSGEPRPRVLEKRLRRKSTGRNTEEAEKTTH